MAMNNLKTLVKYNLINTLNINKIIKNKEKGINAKGKIIISSLVLFAILVLFLVGIYMYFLGLSFAESGAPKIILLMGISFASLMAIMVTITRANTCLFHSRDFQMLSAMPIKTSTILMSKLITLFLINYLFYGLILIPSGIVYAMFNPIDILMVLKFLLVIIIAPFIPISLASGVSYLFGLLTSRMKHKNAFMVILQLVFIIGIMIFSMSVSSGQTTEGQAVEDIMVSMFGKTYYPGLWAFNGITGDWLQLLLFAGVSVVCIGAFIPIVAHNYTKTNNRSVQGYKRTDFKLKDDKVKTRGTVKSLITLEIKKYFGFPGYVMNTLVGPLMGTIMLVMILVFSNSEEGITSLLEGYSEYVVLIAIALVCMFSTISPATSSTISLEGKNFWFLKTLPVPTSKILIAKTLVHILICIPFTIINVILFVWLLVPDVIYGLFIFLFPTLISILMAEVGLFINLCLPKMQWENPIAVLKNSSAVLVTMIIGVVMLVLVGIVTALISILVNIYIGLIVGILMLVVLIIISTFVLKTAGIKKYNAING